MRMVSPGTAVFTAFSSSATVSTDVVGPVGGSRGAHKFVLASVESGGLLCASLMLLMVARMSRTAVIKKKIFCFLSAAMIIVFPKYLYYL